MKKILTRTFCVLFFVVFFATVAFAQKEASAILTEANQQIMGLVNLIVIIVSVLMGLIGAVMLVMALAKYLKGDPSSNDALMKVGGGLLIAVVILQVIRTTLLQ